MSVAYLTFFSNIPFSLGYTRHIGGWGNTLCTYRLHYNLSSPMQFAYNSELARLLGYTKQWCAVLQPILIESEPPDLTRNLPKKEKPLLGIHPGTDPKYPQKRWPVDRFIAVGKRFCEEYGGHILVFGKLPEKDEVEQIVTNIGQYRTKETLEYNMLTEIHLLTKCTLFLGNDSGFTHVAAALGIPTVGIYGPTGSLALHHALLYRHVRLLYVHNKFPCSPCFFTKRYLSCLSEEVRIPLCLDATSPEMVYAALLDLMTDSEETSGGYNP